MCHWGHPLGPAPLKTILTDLFKHIPLSSWWASTVWPLYEIQGVEWAKVFPGHCKCLLSQDHKAHWIQVYSCD